jgi:uncharacterized protein (DUF697 family)
MTTVKDANKIVRGHVLWALGAGLMPIPLLDIAAVTAVQIDMLRQLARLYNVNFSESMSKGFVTALTGSTLARAGASLIKTIPGVGTVIGGVSMSVMSGASTYAIGQVAISYFTSMDGDLSNVDMEWAKRTYGEAFERGKEFVSNLRKEDKENSRDVYEALEKLGQLKEKGIITEEDFEAQNQRLLDRL